MKNITTEELVVWQKEGTPHLLIDVREDWEREQFHIGGKHIPLSALYERRNEIPRDIPVLFYCEKGIRSQLIIQRLEEAGYTNLYNLVGGMKAWKAMMDMLKE